MDLRLYPIQNSRKFLITRDVQLVSPWQWGGTDSDGRSVCWEWVRRQWVNSFNVVTLSLLDVLVQSPSNSSRADLPSCPECSFWELCSLWESIKGHSSKQVMIRMSCRSPGNTLARTSYDTLRTGHHMTPLGPEIVRHPKDWRLYDTVRTE